MLTKPDGTTETQTTEDDGKFSFEVTEAGDYLVGVDPDTLPKGSELARPRRRPWRPRRRAQGRQRRARPVRGRDPHVRAADYDDTTEHAGRVSRAASTGSASACCSRWPRSDSRLIYGTTGLSNFAHAEQVTLGGMLAYLFVNVSGINLGSGGCW